MIATLEMNKQPNYGDSPPDLSTEKHIPVLLDAVIQYLNPQPNAVFFDGTLGMGGHSKAILESIGPMGRLIGIDQDRQSLETAEINLQNFASQCHFVHDNFRNIDSILKQLNISELDGILLDLGLSSFQLDNPERGFSIRGDGPLDMRMDQENPISAFDLVNSLSEKEIVAILRDFGQERWSKPIARHLVAERSKKLISTTGELSQIVLKSIPSRFHRNKRRETIHPSTRTFQAFRIAVNRELEALEVAIEKCVDHLKSGGRMGVISFHSLEDRIVKHKFRALAYQHKVELIFKKPVCTTQGESDQNPRARSAKLRVIQKR